MGFVSFMFGPPMAAIITVGLFLVMFGLIRQPTEVAPPRDAPDWRITVKPEPGEMKNLPDRYQLDPAAPPPPDVRNRTKSSNPGDDFVVPAPNKGVIDAGPMDARAGGAGPAIRVAPPYPETCRARGAEGVVIVEFDVTAGGDVTNLRVIASPNACFDRAVKRAVARWKYTPHTSIGEARPRRGVREALNFQLTE